jgi:hypothetical protein
VLWRTPPGGPRESSGDQSENFVRGRLLRASRLLNGLRGYRIALVLQIGYKHPASRDGIFLGAPIVVIFATYYILFVFFLHTSFFLTWLETPRVCQLYEALLLEHDANNAFFCDAKKATIHSHVVHTGI